MDPKSSISPSSKSNASRRRKSSKKGTERPKWLESIPDGWSPGTQKYIQHVLALDDDEWMTIVRPHVLKEGYYGAKWMEVEPTALREITAKCVDACTLRDNTFKEKFNRVVSEDPLNMIEERMWKKKLVVDFYFKRWNNLRNERERKVEPSDKKKRRIGCPSCNSTNVCCNSCGYQFEDNQCEKMSAVSTVAPKFSDISTAPSPSLLQKHDTNTSPSILQHNGIPPPPSLHQKTTLPIPSYLNPKTTTQSVPAVFSVSLVETASLFQPESFPLPPPPTALLSTLQNSPSIPSSSSQPCSTKTHSAFAKSSLWPQHSSAKDFSHTCTYQEPVSPQTLFDTDITQPTEQSEVVLKSTSHDNPPFCGFSAPTSSTRASSREVIEITDDESDGMVVESSPSSGRHSENQGRTLLVHNDDDEYVDDVRSTRTFLRGRKRPFAAIDHQEDDEEDIPVEEELDFDKVDEILGRSEAETELETNELSYGTAFEKLEYEPCIDETNPWHLDLRRPLFPSQVIGDRWMRDRHLKRGGLVQDRVGLGKTYQIVSFLLWLKKVWVREQRHANPKRERRNLAIIIVPNKNTLTSWQNTLNDEFLRPEDVAHAIWQDCKGLVYWDVERQGEPPVRDGYVVGVDVIIMGNHKLNIHPGQPYWFTKVNVETLIADEAHIYLRGQFNKRDTMEFDRSNTLRHWKILQQNTNSVFLVTGTPLCTNIIYDYAAIAKAVAPEEVRKEWSPFLTDDGLKQLFVNWIKTDSKIVLNDVQKAEQKERATRAAETWAIFTIRREPGSQIRGRDVGTDYEKRCTNYTDPIILINGIELASRLKVYSRHFQDSTDQRGYTKQYNQTMRCLPYSRRYVDWVNKRTPGHPDIWTEPEFTEEEIVSCCRGKRLVEILKEGKATGNGVVVFVDRVFLMEYVANVFQVLKLKWGAVAAKKCVLNGKTWTSKQQMATIRACERGELEAVVVTMKCGGMGCNLQGMSWMVTLGPIGIESEEVQAKGRCNRHGQLKPTRFYVLRVAGEPQDDVPMVMREKRETEATAMTLLQPRGKKKRRKIDKRKNGVRQNDMDNFVTDDERESGTEDSEYKEDDD